MADPLERLPEVSDSAAVAAGADKESLFYEPGNPLPEPLSKDPFKACIVPRPIGWISTRHPVDGDNLAPYSQFFQLTFAPPYCAFAANLAPDGQQKDSARNAEQTGIFCWNQAGYGQRHDVNATASWTSRDFDEFAENGLKKEEAKLVDCALVKASKIKFECRYYTTMRLPGEPPMGSVDIVVGRIIGIHIDKSVLTTDQHASEADVLPVPRPPSPALPALLPGMIDYGKLQPIARMGYNQYAVVTRENLFSLNIPETERDRQLAAKNAARNGTGIDATATNAGLEGSFAANRNLQAGKR